MILEPIFRNYRTKYSEGPIFQWDTNFLNSPPALYYLASPNRYLIKLVICMFIYILIVHTAPSKNCKSIECLQPIETHNQVKEIKVPYAVLKNSKKLLLF